MDKTLQKLLIRWDTKTDSQQTIKATDIMEAMAHHPNCLVTINDRAGKTRLITNLLKLHHANHGTIWLLTSPSTFSSFKKNAIQSGLDGVALSINQSISVNRDITTNQGLSVKQDRSINKKIEKSMGDAPGTIWSVDHLRHHLEALCGLPSEALPDMVIIEDLDMLADTTDGPALEQILIALPPTVPMIGFISPVANHEQILHWLTDVRESTWLTLEAVHEIQPVLSFMTPEFELMPLLQKRKIATKVKKTLKEHRPITSLAKHHFVAPLLKCLKTDALTPTLIVMPSNRLCDQAVQSAPKIREDVTAILSNPQITAMFKRHPVLKDRSNVVAALYKRVGAIHSDNHPAWSEMIELLLSLNLIDAVFTTLTAARSITTRVKSVVFTTSERTHGDGHPGHTTVRAISPIEFQRISHLAHPVDGTNGALILIHGERLDMIRLKDLQLLPTLTTIESQLTPHFQTLLGLGAYREKNLKIAGMTTLRAVQAPTDEITPLLEAMDELTELIPEARCGSPGQAIHYIKMTCQFRFEMDQCDMLMERLETPNERHPFRQRKESLHNALSCFPCHTCLHQNDCQELRYKKIRECYNRYSDLYDEIKQSQAIFEMKWMDGMTRLVEMALLDENLRLTPKGSIALKSGLAFPFYITELTLHRKDFPWPDTMTLPVVAGFVDTLGDTIPSWSKEYVTEGLREAYAWVDAQLEPVRKSVWEKGIVPPEPSFAKSVLIQALENGIPLSTAAASAGTSVGAAIRLMEKTRSLAERLGWIVSV